MPANYILLERIELNASASSVTFSNIPQSGYTDLKIVASARDSYSGVASADLISFNGSTSSFTTRFLQGSGTTANSGTTPNQFAGNNVSATATASTFSNVEIYIPNYTSSNYKSFSVDSVTENNATEAYANLIAGLWSNTAAITSVTLTPTSGSFAQYSTFSLYGLAALGTTPVIAPKASGGNITTDGTYWIHTFLTSGTFTPATALSCDYLVVAGGGGGSAELGGGGGAGGLRSTVTATGGGGSLESPISVASGTAYAIQIGAGGSGGTGGAFDTNNATAGGDSVFSTITATGGGKAGKGTAGTTGGSGGGGSTSGGSSTFFAGGSGTANQGYAGGNNGSSNNPAYGSGGGGGAGAVGGNGSSTTNGNGGNGVAVSITGSSVTYAGGGGAGGYNVGATYASGSGGTGGGGAGGTATNGTSVAGTAGTANLGGGGGAASRGTNTGSEQKAGGNGGSGVVIIRYLVA